MIIGAIDISGDYLDIFGLSYLIMPEWWNYVPTASTALLGVLALIGVWNLLNGRATYRAGLGAMTFLALYTASVVLGVGVGLLRGNPWDYVLGDSRNWIVYLLVFAINDTNDQNGGDLLYGLFALVSTILLAKLGLAIATNLEHAAPLAQRYLLKLSPYLMSMALLSSAMRMSRSGRKYSLMFVLASAGVFLSQTRGIILGFGAGFLALLVFFVTWKRVMRLVVAAALLIVIALVVSIGVWSDTSVAIGNWSGAQFDTTLDVRNRQAQVFLNTFAENPIVGIGLGGYTPEYERFSAGSRRPYLQELEYHNLLAKLGLVGLVLLVGAFGLLFVEAWVMLRNAPVPAQSCLVSGLLAGLVALLVASATNPLYSSVYFHLYVVILLLSLSHVRSSMRFAQTSRGHTVTVSFTRRRRARVVA